MQWIQGFQKDEARLRLKVVDGSGAHTFCDLRDLRSTASERKGARTVQLEGVELNHFIARVPTEFLELWGFKREVPPTHLVYEYTSPAGRLLVPASVVMLGLFSRMSAIGPWLTSASSLDRLAVPGLHNGVPSVTFFPGALTGARERAVTIDRFLWLACFPSSRRAWSSILAHARSGILAVDLPCARIFGSAVGLSRGNTILVTRFHINEVEPTEAPLMLTEHLIGKRFLLSPRGGLTMRPEPLADSEMPQGPDGWQMSDREWSAVSKLLDVRSLASGRARLDEIVLKLGTGQPWDSINKKGDARGYYFRLLRQGRWDMIRQTLLAHRVSSAAMLTA
jgi:hypothetical protein